MTFPFPRSWAFCALALGTTWLVSSAGADHPVSYDINAPFGAALPCDYGGDCGNGVLAGSRCPGWRVAVEGILMRRDQMDAVPLVVDTGSGNTLLFADDLDLGYSEGFRLTGARGRSTSATTLSSSSSTSTNSAPQRP